MGGGDKGEIKNILLQIERTIINQSHPFKKVWKYGQVLFNLFEILYSGGFFKSLVDFTGRHKTLATSRASHGVAEHTSFIKISGFDRLDNCFNIFPSTF